MSEPLSLLCVSGLCNVIRVCWRHEMLALLMRCPEVTRSILIRMKLPLVTYDDGPQDHGPDLLETADHACCEYLFERLGEA